MFPYEKMRLIVCVCVCALMSCGHKNEKIQTVRIPSPIKLTYVSKKVDVDLLIPSKIFIYDGKLVVFEQTSKDLFKVFDLRTFKHLYSFGNIGRANYEISSNIGNDNIIPSEYVEIYDVGRLKYVEFRDTSASIVKEFALPLKKMAYPVNRLNKINDSLYYFDHIYENGDQNEYLKLNIRTREKSTFSPYPNWMRGRFSNLDKYKLYLKSSQYNKCHDKIVSFYYSFPVMKIIDASSGEVISEIHIDKGSYSFDRDNEKIFFTEPFLTDNYIYVLWVNMSKREAGADGSDFKPNIFVFDWAGKLVANYKLDSPVITFTVLEEENKFYCTTFTGTNEIVEYEFPRIACDETVSFIECDFYKMELPSKYDFTESCRESGINKINKSGGYKLNGNYFIKQQENEKIDESNSATIQVGLYEPLDGEGKTNHFIDPTYGELICQRTFPINGIQMQQVIIKRGTTDPRNQMRTYYMLLNRFVIGPTEVRITMTIDQNSYNNQDNYISIMYAILKSFVLKRHLD